MAKPKETKDRPTVEWRYVLGQETISGYKTARITIQKYQESPFTFIDMRQFNQAWEYSDDPDVEDVEVFYPTKIGFQMKEQAYNRLMANWRLVSPYLLHSIVIKKAYRNLRKGDNEVAVFNAFKSVEVRVREKGGYPPELVGVSLMRKAFDPIHGALTDMCLPKAERESLSHLFSGSIGLYKNPFSHREVEYDYGQAIQLLFIASHLHQVLDTLEGAAENEGEGD